MICKGFLIFYFKCMEWEEYELTDRKVVLVVGGNGGIGKSIVEEFVHAGFCTVFTFNRNEKQALDMEEKFGALGYRIDVTDENSIIQLKEILKRKFGRLDSLIYCPGIFEDGLVGDMELDSWNRVMAVNLTGAYLCAKYFIGLLRESGHGRFICIGSVMGESGIYGSCSYAASKAGLIGLVKSIALENARHHVTANVVSLGYIDTGMTAQLSDKVLAGALEKIPMKKAGSPKDVGKLVVSLCEDYTDYLSGQVIRNNGLLYM